jgi:hypothetical protein
METPHSPYSHVFREQPVTPWLRQQSENALSMFHAKYWGKDIHEETNQWKKQQPGYQPMDIDETNALPANFALYFDIDTLNTTNIWVREDYALLYDYCTNRFNRREKKRFSKPSSVVITGQPGVGKWCDFSSHPPFLERLFMKR